jgi:precorrin-2/cobalt-factor-2 C20-methyltransferase
MNSGFTRMMDSCISISQIKESKMDNQIGTFYGIGVGPGEPDLITIKAVKVLSKVDVIFTASSSKNKHSLAVDIARDHIPEKTPIIKLSFPMCMDKTMLKQAWEENANLIVEALRQGKDVAFLTLGDCMTYSTYGYLGRYVKKLAPEVVMVAIPGITSYQAAAARLNRPLVEGEEALLILSGVHGGNRFRELSRSAENVVFMKAYKNISDITQALEEKGCLETSVGISSCGLPEEQIIEDVREFENIAPDYWTLIFSKQQK